MYARVIDGADGKRYVHVKRGIREGTKVREEHVGTLGEFDPISMEQLAYSLLKKARIPPRKTEQK